MKIALCCLMHSFKQCPLYFLEKLRNDTLNNNDVELFLMFENSSNLTIDQISEYSKLDNNHIFIFTWSDIIAKWYLCYHDPERGYVGNCVYPFLDLYDQIKEKFDNFVFIEDDIFYNGDTNDLLNRMNVGKFDVCRYKMEIARRNWWWLKVYRNRILRPKFYTSGLLQLYSLSKRAIDFLYQDLKVNHYNGHHELIVNTLLDTNYCLTKFFYGKTIETHINVYSDPISLYISKNGLHKNAIYHPIKDFNIIKDLI